MPGSEDKGINSKRTWEAFGGIGNVLYLDFSGGYPALAFIKTHWAIPLKQRILIYVNYASGYSNICKLCLIKLTLKKTLKAKHKHPQNSTELL